MLPNRADAVARIVRAQRLLHAVRSIRSPECVRTAEGDMGSVVPFPVPRVYVGPQPRAARDASLHPACTGEVLILPVVQRVRPAPEAPLTLNVPVSDGL